MKNLFGKKYCSKRRTSSLSSKLWAGSQKWIQPPACLDHGLYAHKPRSFPPNRAPKMRKVNNCSLDFDLWAEYLKNSNIPQNPNQNSAAPLAVFFHQVKVRQPIGRKDLFKSWSEQAGGWIHFCMQRLRTLKSFQRFKSEFKKWNVLHWPCSRQ